MLFLIHGRADVERSKLLEAVKIDVLPYPLSFDSEKADKFKSDMKDALPEEELNGLADVLQRTSQYNRQGRKSEGFVSLLN